MHGVYVLVVCVPVCIASSCTRPRARHAAARMKLVVNMVSGRCPGDTDAHNPYTRTTQHILNTTHAPEQPAAISLASILIGGASKILRALLCTLRDLALISLEPMKAGKSQLGSGDEAEMSERPILSDEALAADVASSSPGRRRASKHASAHLR